ncbi:McbB family protein [Pseudomonas sp. Pseusp3]|uniref:McbB family protein n=1 Tax=Pseudomonas sp. Pseusp3 TaxID=3243029 RepID=UPI0039B0830A
MNLIYSEYDIINLPNESLIISSYGVSKTASTKLLSVLQELKKQNKTSITETLLNDTISKQKLQKKAAHLFLQNAIGLKPEPSEIYFKKALIAHDCIEIEEFKTTINQELTCEYIISENIESLTEQAKGNSYFIIIMCMQYDYIKLKKLYFSLADAAPCSAISLAYLNGNIFHIDQPYVPSIGNPCHFCMIDRQLNYEKCINSQNSWTTLLRFCIERNVTLPSQKLSALQRSMAIGAIVKKIKLHTEHGSEFRYQDNVFTSTTVDLIKGSITEEPSPHWHSCNCLRSKNEKYTA